MRRRPTDEHRMILGSWEKSMMNNQQVYDSYRSAGFHDTDSLSVSEGYSQLLQWMPSLGAPILDLGCGGGEFLEFLQSKGFTNLHGIDRSLQQVARCQERGLTGIEVVIDSTQWLQERKQKFSCVVLNDVLEHIPKQEIVPTLNAIRSALISGGCVIIKVPNAANAFGLVARYLDFTHEVAFTEHSLKQVLIASMFADIDVSGMRTQWRWTLKRSAYWLMNTAYQRMHRALYIAAVGTDAPTILSKLLIARGVRPSTD